MGTGQRLNLLGTPLLLISNGSTPLRSLRPRWGAFLNILKSLCCPHRSRSRCLSWGRMGYSTAC